MNIHPSLLSVIDGMNEEFVRHWVNLCNLESPTYNKAAVDACGQYIVDFAGKHGWKVEKLPLPTAGDPLCITMNPDAAGRPIALSGHIDTVHPIGLFGSPAVRVDAANDAIYGPGVTDCKGGVIGCMYAMAALEKVGFTARPVMLLIQTDEEVSSRLSEKATINWMCEKAKDCEAFLNTETYAKGKACLWRKGILRYHLKIKGVSAHSSICGVAGVSAIAEAAHKILELEKQKDQEGLTASCGMINGGTAENTVPEECTFTVDFRFADEAQMRQADALVRRVGATSYLEGTSCEVTLAGSRLAMPKTDRNFALLERMNKVYAAYGMEELLGRGSNGGSDAAEVTCAGIPCIDSLGTRGRWIHTVREEAKLSSLAESAKLMATVVYSLE